MRRSKLFLVFLTVLILSLLSMLMPATAQAELPAQTVVSSSGLIARGSLFWDRMTTANGEPQEFRVELVVPQGEITSTGTIDGLDLARPTVRVSAWRYDALWYHTQSCWSASNTDSFGAGGLNPSHEFPDGRYNPPDPQPWYGPSWEGVWVDVRCDDGSGYDFYRVEWTENPWSWLYSTTLSINQQTDVETWSAENAQGTLTTKLQKAQTTDLRVCGWKSGVVGQCFTGVGGWVLPQTGQMISTARPYTTQVPLILP
jgi:hypothetical protein